MTLAQTILRSLLGKGYFPKELPPVFTTSDFGEHAEKILGDWLASELYTQKTAKDFPKINGKIPRGRAGFKRLVYADPEIISKPKKFYERRNIHITHPIPQALLTNEIAHNWRNLQKILTLRKYSKDEIIVSDNYDRSIKGINFLLHRAKKEYIESTADWLVKTDISRFYPSIYTHSIPWAAYGKEKVKSSIKMYEGSFADRLDVLVRACNRNQTVGLPIGPETSRILAEIISSRIDFQFSSDLPKLRVDAVDRLQDDWMVGAGSLEEAEKILSVISACYRDYGLEINGTKTSITHILGSRLESWRSEISAFLSHRSGGLYGSRMQEFLSLCFRLQLASPGEPVMNYALGIIEGRKYARSDVQALESFLLKAAAVSPASMDRICRIIINIEYQMGGLSRDRLVSRFLALAERHFSTGALFEAIWLIYTIRGLKKPVRSTRIVELVEHTNSSVLRLLLMDMGDKGIFQNKIPAENWAQEASHDRVLSDWSWLYAYEAIRKGWMPDPHNLLQKPFFKAMHDRDVVFYDPEKNVRSSWSLRRDMASERARQTTEVVELLNSLRGAVDFDQWENY